MNNKNIKSEDGFTLIEITMALILLGILGAVAVPKYFDMQEQAAIKKCKYSQSVAVSDMQNRDAIHRIDSNAYTTDEAKLMANQVLKDLGGEGCESDSACPNLCPMQTKGHGQFHVVVSKDLEGSITYKLICSLTGHSNNTVVSADNGYPLLDLLANGYMESYNNGNKGLHQEKTDENGKDLSKVIETLGDYFTNYLKYPKQLADHIDSDPYFDKDNDSTGLLDYGKDSSGQAYNSMAELINATLADQMIDTSQVVWQIKRDDSLSKSENGGWRCMYTVSIADLSGQADGASVTVQNYQMTVTYNPPTMKDPVTGLVGTESIKTVQEKTPSTGTLKLTTDEEGNSHYQLVLP